MVENEIWKDIPGYEGKYQASTQGRIKSLDMVVQSKNHYTNQPFSRRIPGRVLRPGRFCKAGHLSVVLGRGTSGKPVHQLIMRTFVGEPQGGKEVLHNNGDPTDNRLLNLRYGTRTENILDVYRQGGRWRKLTVSDVETIRFWFMCGMSGAAIAKHFGISPAHVSKIKRKGAYSWLE